MRKSITMAALAGLIALPLMAGPADAATCHHRKQTGTILGGLGGALLGNSISGGGGGAVIGGVGGAVVGHEIGKGGCKERRVYRSASRTRYAPASNSPAVRKVYYDQYGNAVGSAPVNR